MTTITISGLPGTGKTTVANLLKAQLGLPYVYSGEIFREMAKKQGMSLEEFGEFCEKHPETDKELDQNQLEILRKGNVILEGRISGWIAYRNNIPALKVLLEAPIDVRAGRIVKREQGGKEKRKKEILKREKCEVARYKKYYDIDVYDTSIYDLVIDVSNKTPEEITKRIVERIKK